MSESTDDPSLLAEVRQGGERAFRRLYRLHAGRVYAVALRLLGSRDAADDVAQEAWFRAVRGLPAFRMDSAFSTWVVGITVRCAFESLKRTGFTAVEPEGVVRLDPPVELSLDLEAALAALAPGYRTVLVLHDVEGYTHDEIGAILEIDVGTSKSQLSRARRAVRERLRAAHERTTP